MCARVRGHLRHLPHRRGHPRLPALHRARRRATSTWSRPTPRSRACSTAPTGSSRSSPRRIELDLSTVVPSLAGPSRPQDLVSLAGAGGVPDRPRPADPHRGRGAGRSRPTTAVTEGDVVVAAITSCTNTSNPQVMVAAGLLAQHAVERGLALQAVGQDLAGPRARGWSWTTSTGPGSPSPSSQLGLRPGRLRLHDLHRQLRARCCPGVSEAVHDGDLSVASVLSGNRNFEGRIHPDVRMNYLASPPLVVAYALAGTMDIDLTTEPLGTDADGQPVFLADLWPTPEEVTEAIRTSLTSEMFRQPLRLGVRRRRALAGGAETATGDTFGWDHDSTYVLRPALPRGPDHDAGPGHRRRRRPGAGHARGQRHHRPHLPGRHHRPGHPGRPLPDRARRRAAATSTPTGPGGATTR